MQNELDKDEYLPLTRKDNILFFTFFGLFTIIWVMLVINLPKSFVIGYFVFLTILVSTLFLNSYKEKKI